MLWKDVPHEPLQALVTGFKPASHREPSMVSSLPVKTNVSPRQFSYPATRPQLKPQRQSTMPLTAAPTRPREWDLGSMMTGQYIRKRKPEMTTFPSSLLDADHHQTSTQTEELITTRRSNLALATDDAKDDGISLSEISSVIRTNAVEDNLKPIKPSRSATRIAPNAQLVIIDDEDSATGELQLHQKNSEQNLENLVDHSESAVGSSGRVNNELESTEEEKGATASESRKPEAGQRKNTVEDDGTEWTGNEGDDMKTVGGEAAIDAHGTIGRSNLENDGIKDTINEEAMESLKEDDFLQLLDKMTEQFLSAEKLKQAIPSINSFVITDTTRSETHELGGESIIQSANANRNASFLQEVHSIGKSDGGSQDDRLATCAISRPPDAIPTTQDLQGACFTSKTDNGSKDDNLAPSAIPQSTSVILNTLDLQEVHSTSVSDVGSKNDHLTVSAIPPDASGSTITDGAQEITATTRISASQLDSSDLNTFNLISKPTTSNPRLSMDTTDADKLSFSIKESVNNSMNFSRTRSQVSNIFWFPLPGVEMTFGQQKDLPKPPSFILLSTEALSGMLASAQSLLASPSHASSPQSEMQPENSVNPKLSEAGSLSKQNIHDAQSLTHQISNQSNEPSLGLLPMDQNVGNASNFSSTLSQATQTSRQMFGLLPMWNQSTILAPDSSPISTSSYLNACGLAPSFSSAEMLTLGLPVTLSPTDRQIAHALALSPTLSPTDELTAPSLSPAYQNAAQAMGMSPTLSPANQNATHQSPYETIMKGGESQKILPSPDRLIELLKNSDMHRFWLVLIILP